jgi:beta-galactosidase
MKPFYFFATILFAVSLSSCTEKNSDEKREILFNSDWKFIRADVLNAQQTDFDDSGWRNLDLPHDYSIEDLAEKEGVKQIGPFSEESAGGKYTANMVGGTAWYRKHFTFDKNDSGKIISVLFDGVYMNSDVWLNGHHLGNHPYGYTAFAYDLTPFLKSSGEKNVLAVQVKNEGKNSRWYSGSGIFRDVKLIKTNPVHFDLWGVAVKKATRADNKATVEVSCDVVNQSGNKKSVAMNWEILDTKGKSVASFKNESMKMEGNKINVAHTFELSDFRVWSPESPELYTLVAQVLEGSKVIDEVSESFGIRSVEFSVEKGFLLNGKNLLLKGGCLHHDNGPLGAAAFKTAEYRRVKIMKENGFNAIRTAHNPPSKLFLEACDKLGMLVIDESFDQWQLPKNPQDYNLYFDDWWERDIESMVKRDRNHPSIIIWSVGNEIKERADSSGLAIALMLKEKVKSLDSSRPVTQAMCEFWEFKGRTWDESAPAFAQMDVHAYNYMWKEYQRDHELYPERIIIGTETTAKEAFDNWQQAEKYSYVLGDFVWTGMDHLGESGIGSTWLDNEDFEYFPPWPWFINYSGDISILGHKKPQMYYRDVLWRNSELEMLVHAPVPPGRKEIVSRWGWPNEWKCWNWDVNEGAPMQVSVYTRCQQVRLELNGKVIGTQNVSDDTRLTAQFDVPWQPGELTAIALNDGKEVTRQTLKTTGKPAQLRVTSEKDSVSTAVDDLAYFNIEVLDENGFLVPDAIVPVQFTIEGSGKLQGVASENPTEMASFQQPKIKTWRGKCQLIVRLGKEGEKVKVAADADGLKGSEVVVYLKR